MALTLKEEILQQFSMSKKKHLILTGSKKSGKSTRLENLIENKSYLGIKTWAEFCGQKTPRAIYLQNRKDGETVIIGRPVDNKMKVETENFEVFAKEILENILNSEEEIAVIDELGYLEKDCKSYLESLKLLFKNKKVIATVRKDCLDFYQNYFGNDALILDVDEITHRKIACLVLAAGKSERFEGNKLLADFFGETVLERTLNSLDKKLFDEILVVTASKEAKRICDYKEINSKLIETDSISESIRKGISELKDFDAVMLRVADQPLLKKQTIQKMVDKYLLCDDKIVRLYFDALPSNPSIFPKSLIPELAKLSGDNGGKAIIKKHEEMVLKVDASKKYEILDVDTKEKLEQLKMLYAEELE